MTFLLKLEYSCGCTESFGPVTALPEAEELDHHSPEPCPSGVGEPCRYCAEHGLCLTRRARGDIPAPLEATAEPIGPRRRRKLPEVA